MNHTRCYQHDCTSTKAMDITYLLIIVQFFLNRYYYYRPGLISKMLW